jgi:hypothetical protein
MSQKTLLYIALAIAALWCLTRMRGGGGDTGTGAASVFAPLEPPDSYPR